jgi:hypothetical protein
MSTQLLNKWRPILEHQDLPEIKDPYRKAATAQLLENQERFLREQSQMNSSNGLFLTEAPVNVVGATGYEGGADPKGPVAGFDPVLIGLIRRTMPNLIAYDICGVQPMSGPTGLVFAMRALYNNQTGNEALFDEPNPKFSNIGSNANNATDGATPTASNPGLLGVGNPAAPTGNPPYPTDSTGGGATYDPILGPYPGMGGMDKDVMEKLGDPTGTAFREMSFSIEKAAVEARGRALKATYTMELAQDLRAIHGLDAEAELSNILSSEILAEINRELIRTVYRIAKPGAQNNVAVPGTFNLDVDSNGRWSVEKFKGLLFQVERDLNAIAQLTRRGKGNYIICSADVASALTMAGVLDYTPALQANLNVDDTGNLFAGTINGKLKVYIDPFSANISNDHFYVAGYKGSNAYDAGLFYCPYVPLQMVRSVTADSFQPNIGFKTRYGLIANPFAEGRKEQTQGLGRLADNSNRYYRRVKITNLM